MLRRVDGVWDHIQTFWPRAYQCAYCDHLVSSEHGWRLQYGQAEHAQLYVCPHCNQPTFFAGREQVPGARIRGAVHHLPPDVAALYEEARAAHAASAFTAAVLALRKLLMHVAVEKGAAEGLPFLAYVEYLDSEKYLGRDGKGWVDLIRTKSNEANHEITLMDTADSERLLTLAEMLLRLVYEFPGSLPAPPATNT